MSAPRFPKTAPNMKLSSTGSAASNFQSFPTLHTAPRGLRRKAITEVLVGPSAREISNQK